jgi:hypothetical protein
MQAKFSQQTTTFKNYPKYNSWWFSTKI